MCGGGGDQAYKDTVGPGILACGGTLLAPNPATTPFPHQPTPSQARQPWQLILGTHVRRGAACVGHLHNCLTKCSHRPRAVSTHPANARIRMHGTPTPAPQQRSLAPPKGGKSEGMPSPIPHAITRGVPSPLTSGEETSNTSVHRRKDTFPALEEGGSPYRGHCRGGAM